ncbi:Protein ssh4 [Tilletia horrida]|nr:Protein ssh4 [Tilletia horrida]
MKSTSSSRCSDGFWVKAPNSRAKAGRQEKGRYVCLDNSDLPVEHVNTDRYLTSSSSSSSSKSSALKTHLFGGSQFATSPLHDSYTNERFSYGANRHPYLVASDSHHLLHQDVDNTPTTAYDPNSPSDQYWYSHPERFSHDRTHGFDDGIGLPLPGDDPNGVSLLLPFLVLLSSMLFFLLVFIILVILLRRRARIALSEHPGPHDIGREEELEGHGGLDGIEARWLEGVEEAVARGWARAKEWVAVNPPASAATDITISQSLAIQEKGVSAWAFEPDYEDNPSVFVVGRTEITFLADGQGMAAEEGGGTCVLSNLPVPKLNEVYYWEVKIFSKPESTNLSIGLVTKPYPGFRLPGWSKFSVGYFSQDGFKCHNYPFTAQSYGPAYVQGDVVGVGYRPRTGTVFYTRNGRKMEDAFVGLNRHNYFPCIGADGAAEIYVNLGQAEFVNIEANVKKWGLAPSTGTLPPPPAYGVENGSILIESAGQGSSRSQVTDVGDNSAAAAVANAAIARRNALRAQNNHALPPPPPISPRSSSPPPNASSSTSSGRRRQHRNRRPMTATSNASEDDHGTSPHNPPTPHELDISLHSLRSSVPSDQRRSSQSSSGVSRISSGSQMQGTTRRASPGPPPYASVVPHRGSNGRRSSRSRRTSSSQQVIDAADLLDAASSSSSMQDASVFRGLNFSTLQGSSRRSASGSGSNGGGGNAVSNFASAVLNMLTDRGLLTPMSAESLGGGRTPGSGSGPFSSQTESGGGREGYFPPMTPAQQRAAWDRERVLLAEQQAAASAAGRGGARPSMSRASSYGAGVPVIRTTAPAEQGEAAITNAATTTTQLADASEATGAEGERPAAAPRSLTG